MAEISAGDEGSRKPKAAADLDEASPTPSRLPLKVVIPLGIVAAILLLAHGTGKLPEMLRTVGLMAPVQEVAPTVITVPPDMSGSQEKVTAADESVPADPKSVLPLLHKPLLPAGEEKPDSSAAVSVGSAEPDKATELSPRVGSPSAGEVRPSAETLKAVERPSIVTREPQPAAVSDREPARKAGVKATSEESAAPTREKVVAAMPKTADQPPEPGEQKGKTVQETDTKKADPAAIPSKTPPEPEDRRRSEQFQLPGSLIVRIQNYSGAPVKWDLMVILDDSLSMARKSKTFEPSRLQTATGFIAKIPNALIPGSKLAVRDFECPKTEPKAKRAASHCPTRLLYEWADAPFKGLSEKLEQSHPGGKNNPCAAAAYSLKKDFSGAAGLTPRMLIITDSATNCRSNEVLRAIDEQWGRGKLPVDVITLGMNKKRKENYSVLAKRTDGLFFTVESPSELEAAFTRYSKMLKTPILEKVEIRGDRTTLTANVGQEVTLVPGSYTVVLPLVGGLTPSKRVVEDVKITSQKNTLLEVVREKKGKLTVRIGR